MKKVISTLLILILILSFQLAAKSSTKKIDQILNNLFEQDSPGGVALIVKDGKTIYRKAFGMANLELAVKMTPDFIFRVGSVTKQFTAAAIIQLAEQGKLDLTAEINQYLKDYPTQGQKITIENLLTHTSGIKNYTSTKEWTPHKKKQDLNSSELIDFFKDQEMTMAPGEREEYSNSNYVLLGRIIEVVSGKSYEDYLQEHIFKPLKMTKTSYDSPKRIIKNRAYGYAKLGNIYENADYISMTQPFASGAIVSTVDDLAKWQQGLFSYKVINKESLTKASEPFVLNNGSTAGYGYNWGFNGFNIQGEPMISYNGAIDGFSASTKYIPSKKIFVVILSNIKENYPKINMASDRLAAIALGKPYEWKAIDLEEETLLSYEGVYTSEKYGVRHIVFDNNELLFYQPGGKKLKLYPFEKNRFFFEDPDYLVKTIEINNKESMVNSTKMRSSGRDKLWNKTDKTVLKFPVIKIKTAELQKFTGKYELAPNFYLTLFVENDKLYSQATGQSIHKLRAYGNEKFVSETADIQHIFNYDENNSIQSVSIRMGKNQYDAKKIE